MKVTEGQSKKKKKKVVEKERDCDRVTQIERNRESVKERATVT